MIAPRDFLSWHKAANPFKRLPVAPPQTPRLMPRRRCKRCGKVIRKRQPLRNRGLLVEDTGADFMGLAVYDDTDSDTYIVPVANPNGGSGSGSGPCCCCEAAGCNFGTTPATLSLTASGIDYTTIVNMCIAGSQACFGQPYKITALSNPNNTFTLSHSVSGTVSCGEWALTLVNVGSVTFYEIGAIDCSGAVAGTNTINLTWSVTRQISPSASWLIQLIAKFEPTENCGGILFDATVATDPTIDCTGTVTADNDLGAIGTVSSVGLTIFGNSGSIIFHPA